MKKSKRLWNDWLLRIKINKKIFMQKKEFLTEMLYDREICLIWKFLKIEKIQSKINSSLKIGTVFHQIWQISNFQIIRVPNDVISMMIKNRLRNKILKSCYDLYRNFWFLVAKKNRKRLIYQYYFKNKSNHYSKRHFFFCCRFF